MHRMLLGGVSLTLGFTLGCVTSAPMPQFVVTQKDSPLITSRPQGVPVTEEQLLQAKFKGKHRKDAKTSVSQAPVEQEYESLDELLDTLPSDADMQEIFEDIAEEADDPKEKFRAPRQPDEERNVRVRAWLAAVKFEEDQDFHVILASSRSGANRSFLNVEVSGLPNPESNDTPRLREVRQQLLDLVGRFPRSRYAKLNPPVPVEVEGSIFFDVDHGPGTVGPAGMRPATSWEIHPITDLDGGHD